MGKRSGSIKSGGIRGYHSGDFSNTMFEPRPSGETEGFPEYGTDQLQGVEVEMRKDNQLRGSMDLLRFELRHQ